MDVTPESIKVQSEPFVSHAPASEHAMYTLASLLNYIRESISPVGTVVASMLDESTFQAQNDSSPIRWVLADGQSVIGSKYQTLTGQANVLDLRGIMVRAANGDRDDDLGDPANAAVLAYNADRNKSHTHSVTDPGHVHGINEHGGHTHLFNQPISLTPFRYDDDDKFPFTYDAHGVTDPLTMAGLTKTGITIKKNSAGVIINTSGGGDSAPRNVTVNWFVRIN